jgi:hypothetical protein
MDILLKILLRKSDKIYLFYPEPFKRLLMTRIGKIDRSGLGNKIQIIRGIPAIPIFYKQERKIIGAVTMRLERQFGV